MRTIQDRKERPRGDSYTSRLLEEGILAIGNKIIEEAHEVVESATRPQDSFSPDHLRHEAADLVYHLCVALAYHDIDWSDVERELDRRSQRSGLAEKASRRSADQSKRDAIDDCSPPPTQIRQ